MTKKLTCTVSDLDRVLVGNEVATGASECHGILCGMICALGRVEPAAWIGQIIGEHPSEQNVLFSELKQLLGELYKETMVQLNDPELGLSLLVEDEEQDLARSIITLKEWCDGFLFGLSLAGIRIDDQLSEDVYELLQDIIEITRVDFEFEEDGESDYQAFYEVLEYVRMGVIFLYDEWQPLSPHPTTLQ